MVLTRQMQTRLSLTLVLLLTLSVWLVSGAVLYRGHVERAKSEHLNELAMQLIRRAEKAVDYLVIVGTDFLISEGAACTAGSKDRLRELALFNANILNFSLVAGAERCFSFDEFRASLPSDMDRAAWQIGRNADFRFGPMESGGRTLLGVSWGYGTSLELIAVFDSNALLFDVLQGDLRRGGRISLLVGDAVVAMFAEAETPSSDGVGFTYMSARYPLRVDIKVDAVQFAAWRDDVPLSLTAIWAMLGLFVAGLAVFALARGRNPHLDALRDALDRGEMVPFFQPIVDLATGRVIGCEVLARWVKPDGRQVPPSAFVPLIEQHGLEDALFDALMSRTAAELGPHFAVSESFYFGFNVTPSQLASAGVVDRLTRTITKLGLRPERICVEVTERHLVASLDTVAKSVEALIDAGFRVAIDDAGTGHNGLSTIQQLSASTLKIDKFFVDHVGEDPKSRIMIEMFVAVAQRCGMATIAEGAETAEQVALLKAAGVNAVQGYYVSRPLPAPEFLFALESKWGDLDLHEPAADTAFEMAS